MASDWEQWAWVKRVRSFLLVAVRVAHVYAQHICMEAEKEKQRGVGLGEPQLPEAGEICCSCHMAGAGLRDRL